MPCRILLAAFTFFLTVGRAQLSFDVASVRPTQHGRDQNGYSRSFVKMISPGTLSAVNASFGELIGYAYDIKAYQLSCPEWMTKSDDAGFDILAKTDAATPEKDIRLMLQTLLAERLKVKLHRESKTLPVYHLVVAKNGPKLKPAPADAPNKNSVLTVGGRMTAEHIGMARFAEALAREIEQPVFDKTGISGAFDITLEYARRNDTSGERPSIFAAVVSELGLKLESVKAPVEILVVDSAERIPTEN